MSLKNNNNNNSTPTTDDNKNNYCYITDTNRYDAALSWIHNIIQSGHELLFDPQTFHTTLTNASHRFGYPFESLHSLLRNRHLTHVKKSTRYIRDNCRFRYINAYIDGTSLVQLAKDANYPPYMMARLILEQLVGGFAKTTTNGRSNVTKKSITEAMRDPVRMLGRRETIIFRHERYERSEGVDVREAIRRRRLRCFSGGSSTSESSSQQLSRLAMEVMNVIDTDPIYGPRHDRIRRIIGLEHEIMLEQSLKVLNIPFETESQLRIRGTARTPDILLSCPIGVKLPKRQQQRRHHNQQHQQQKQHLQTPSSSQEDEEDDNDIEYEWKVVCWIDSKAYFGDDQTHNYDVLPQAEAFVHRFGPGLLLYWFGHAPLERLADGHGDVAIVGWNLPECVVLPTGEFVMGYGGSMFPSLAMEKEGVDGSGGGVCEG